MLFALAMLPVQPARAADPTVRTAQGLVQGATAQGVDAYLGIPFAAPPVDALRWRPPQLARAWSRLRRADRYGPSCPQIDTLGAFAAPSREEDCLYLNVFAPPGARGRKLPVMVWIYGGGLRAGAAQDYDPTALAREGVVVVTFNYRLGILGYFADPAFGASPNYGMLDQIAALAWVKQNIAAFGGDPGAVTIFGESAGARSVAVLLASPPARGLFRAAIMESVGYSGTTLPLAAAQAKGQAFATAVGCPQADAACLRALPVDRLLATQGPYAGSAIAGTPELPDALPAALGSGRFNRVPVIAGWNRDEATWQTASGEVAAGKPTTAEDYARAISRFAAAAADPRTAAERIAAAYPLAGYQNPGQAVAAISTDFGFVCPTRQMLRALAPWAPVRAYEFADRDSPQYNPPGSFPFGAAHTNELQFLFPGFHGATGTRHPLTPAEQQLAATMRRLWTNFAKTRDPNRGAGPTPAWTPYDPVRDDLLVLETPNAHMQGAPYNDARQCDLWDSLAR